MKTESFIVYGVILFLIILIAVILTYLMLNPVQAQTPPENQKKKKPVQLYVKKDDNPEHTALLAKEVFSLCPPLRPDRLKRRMKMLWGIDLADYPADGLIVLAGDLEANINEGEEVGGNTGSFVLAPNHGLIWMQTYQNSIFEDMVPASFPPEKYALFYRYLMMSDTEALQQYWDKYKETFNVDFVRTMDFMLATYDGAVFDARKTILEYKDKNTREISLLSRRTSDLRFDAFHLYFESERKKGRQIYIRNLNSVGDHSIPREAIHLEEIGEMSKGWIFNIYDVPEWISVRDYLYGGARVAAWFSAHLRYQIEGMNNTIVKCLYSNDFSGYTTRMKNREEFKKSLKPNNYYGYTVLREFLENPMREMPTLEKIGASFRACVKESNTLLLLEPFADSYDIDTVQPVEFLKAYEMGHDDYWFVEVEKPVESPVADMFGYATILDRTETVYGYIPKQQVKALTDADILLWETMRDTTKSKLGIIDDPDGYVNIRKGQSAQSEIAGQIRQNEVFRYWELPTNWCVVETEAGLRGFVYKNRIKEYRDKGKWKLLD